MWKEGSEIEGALQRDFGGNRKDLARSKDMARPKDIAVTSDSRGLTDFNNRSMIYIFGTYVL